MPFIPKYQEVRHVSPLAFGVAALFAFLAASCSTTSPAASQTGTPVAASSAAPVALSPEDAKFYAFIRDFRDTALAAGITPATYDFATANIKRNARVMQLNADQPEFSKHVWAYLDTAVSDRRVTDGLNAMNANLNALVNIENRTGVPKEILVSIWGNESNYGSAMGGFNMFEALATLAHDGPRTSYGRPQLIGALQMMQKEKFTPSQMTCSWAGAFGHTQLIPTEFLLRAVDGDRDGVRDMWRSVPDALASTANIMIDYGWKRGEPAYVEVTLPPNFPYELADADTHHPVSEWKRLGVKRVTGQELAGFPDHGAIYVPAGVRGPAFLVFDNWKAILRYNNAASYALAIAYLAKRIHGDGLIVGSWPREERALTKDERVQFQTALKTLGFDPGKIDGVIGRGSRAQLRLYQKSRGIPADGFATAALLARLSAEAAKK